MRTLWGLFALGALGITLAIALAPDSERQRTATDVTPVERSTRTAVSKGLAQADALVDESDAPERTAERGGLIPVSVKVTTIDLAGDPVADIQVTLTVVDRDGVEAELTSNAEGLAQHTFWARRTGLGHSLTLRATLTHDGYPELQTSSHLSPLHFVGNPVQLPLVAEPGRTIRGRVIDAAGKPAPSANVRFGTGDGTYHVVRAGDAGDWELHVRPNLKTLFVHARFLFIGSSKLTRIDVHSHEVDELVTLQLIGPKRISGRVLDSLGRIRKMERVVARLTSQAEPVEGGAVVAYERLGGLSTAFAFADTNGHFSLHGLQNVEYTLRIGETELMPHPSEREAWLLPVVGFYLDATRSDGTRGMLNPRRKKVRHDPGFTPTVTRIDQLGLRSEISVEHVEVNGEGIAAIELAEAGSFSLQLVHRNEDVLYTALPELALGQHPTVRVQLESDRACTLRPAFPSEFTVSLHGGSISTDYLRHGTMRVVDRASGLVVEDPPYYGDRELNVPPGSYSLYYRPRHGNDWFGSATVARGEELDVPMTEQAGAEVAILVEWVSGKRGQLLAVLRSESSGLSREINLFLDWGELSQTSDNPDHASDCVFAAQPGAYSLSIRHEDGRTETRSVTLRAGAREVVRVKF